MIVKVKEKNWQGKSDFVPYIFEAYLHKGNKKELLKYINDNKINKRDLIDTYTLGLNIPKKYCKSNDKFSNLQEWRKHVKIEDIFPGNTLLYKWDDIDGYRSYSIYEADFTDFYEVIK